MPTIPIPGVPPLPGGKFIAPVLFLAADAISLFSGIFLSQWGLFQDGFPVISTGIGGADSVITVDYKQDWSVSTFPVEQGAFESYDKVATPFQVRMRFSAGGDAVSRELLLASVAAVANTTDLFDIVTPEVTYRSVNVMHYDYARSASAGVGLLVIDVWCVQVRVTVQTSFSSVKNPIAGSPQAAGTVTPGPSVPPPTSPPPG